MRRLCAFISVMLLSGCVAVAEHARPEALPITDAHGHLNRDIPAERLLSEIDHVGVKAMVLMARYYVGRYGGKAAMNRLWSMQQGIRNGPQDFSS